MRAVEHGHVAYRDIVFEHTRGLPLHVDNAIVLNIAPTANADGADIAA